MRRLFVYFIGEKRIEKGKRFDQPEKLCYNIQS